MSTLIARIDTFTKNGRFVARGAPVDSSEVDYDAETSDNLIEAPDGLEGVGAVEVSAIAPTGPNPQNPQQIAPGVVQADGGYYDRGARLVGEVTKPEAERMAVIIEEGDDSQSKVEEALADADAADRNNNDDALVAGTVADVTANLGDKSDAELKALRAAEEDRERPRSGVTSAIDAELARR